MLVLFCSRETVKPSPGSNPSVSTSKVKSADAKLLESTIPLAKGMKLFVVASAEAPLKVRFTGSGGNTGAPLESSVGLVVLEEESAFKKSKKNGISINMCGLPGSPKRFMIYLILSKRCGRIALASQIGRAHV